MNPRIRELADKVADLMPAGVYNVEYESSKSGIEFTEDALEKFAELIVRECARIVNENDFEGSIVGDGMLFEHFGVE